MINNDPDSPGFNSYVSVDELKAFASARGYELPPENALCEQFLIQAMDYLESVEWRGSRSSSEQPLMWPRNGVAVDGVPVNKSVIPARLKSAQCRLAIEAQETDLNPTKSGGTVTLERVEGAVTVQYDGSSNDGTVTFPWLSPLLRGLTKGTSVFNFDVRRG